MTYIKRQIIAEGKTKKIWSTDNGKPVVIIEFKDDITALDNPSLTQILPGKAIAATATTCNVFHLLKKANVPVAYIQPHSPTEFVAWQCNMMPLEIVVRRLAIGSILKRCPELSDGATNDGKEPARFSTPVVELFLKTTGGKLVMPDGQILVEGLDPLAGEEDPFIPDASERYWRLQHPKARLNTPEADLHRQVDSQIILGESAKHLVNEMKMFARQAFIKLEKAWQDTAGYRLVDFKLEFGILGRDLYIADVIDSDSWRLWTPEGQDLSKQVFRDGGPLDQVLANYQHVAELSRRFAA